jgi:Sel1 repeat
MKKLGFRVSRALLLGLGLWTLVNGDGARAQSAERQRFLEQEHFLGCLAYVYNPALWISYNGVLYFMPKTEAQIARLRQMIDARSRYSVLTNRRARHALAAKALAESGIDPAWQKRILLPYSVTNENLTPTLSRQLRIVSTYKFLRAFGEDAFIEAGNSIYFVMDYRRGGSLGANTNALASGTNAFLIKEGWKTFTTSSGQLRRVEAFTNVALDNQETAVLDAAVAGFRKAAASLAEAFSKAAAKREDFESLKSRASDASPYLEYLLAKAYLDGKGTEKDETLGMEWMRRAAANGSGDALSYLEDARVRTN